jgi:hypothetical protein
MDYDRDVFATLAGGYPWPPDLAPDDGLARVLRDQLDAGVGLLADGRVHAAPATPDALVAAWRSTREAVAREAAARAAPELPVPELPVKMALRGPWAAAGAHGALDAARRLSAALHALADAGCPLAEIHEPSPSLPSDDAGRAVFAAAHAALLDGLAERMHASLAITGGDALALGAEALFAAPYRSHLFDLLDGPESWRLVALAPGERGIVVGVGDASGRRRTRLEDLVWAAGYAASTRGRGMDRVGIAPSASLAGLAPDRAQAVLALLGEAARIIAAGGGGVLERLDPRAIDARSAALGQYQPQRRRPGG